MSEQEQSRRDVLAAALESATSETSAPEQAAAPEQPAEQPAVEQKASEETAAAKAERARHSDGTFAKEKARKAAAEAKEQKAAAARTPRKYPTTWKPDYQSVWNEIDADDKRRTILDEVERRENDYHKGIEQYKADATYASTIKKAIAPFEASIRAIGAKPEQAVEGLLRADHMLRYGTPQQKQAAFQHLIRSYSLDPAWAKQERPDPVDPNVAHMQQQLAQVQQQNQHLHQTFQKQMLEQANSEIEAFKKDAPYLEDVRGEMGRLIQAGLASGVRDAYEKAVYSNPTTRAKVLAEQQAKDEAERKAKAAQQAQAAKAAAVQVRGAPSGDTKSAPGKGKDRRSMIAALMNDAA